MTTATASFAWGRTSTDGTVQQTWVNGVKNLLTAAGLVQTSDTGQLNHTGTYVVANTNPQGGGSTTNGSYLGYNIWRFPDTLQATQPILLRTDFRVDGDGLNSPSVKFTVSGATNGAGVMATPLWTHTNVPGSNVVYNTPLTSYACYVDGTFTCVLGVNVYEGYTTNNNLGAVVVDRARTTLGAALGNGYLVEGPNPQGTNASHRSMYGPASPAATPWLPTLIPSGTATSSSDGADVNVFRHYMMVPGVRPSLGALTYYNSEFGALAPITATVLGSSHTYLPMGRAFNYASVASAYDPSSAANHSVMIRWE